MKWKGYRVDEGNGWAKKKRDKQQHKDPLKKKGVTTGVNQQERQSQGSFDRSQASHHYTGSTMTAKKKKKKKKSSWLAIHLSARWKANIVFVPLSLSVNNSKSRGTQMPVVPNVQSLKSLKTWLVFAFTKHDTQTWANIHKPTKACRHTQANTHITICQHRCTRHACKCTHFSTPNIPVSSLSSLWQPVCQSRNASLDYSFLSYSLVVVLGGSQGCWLADSVADEN